MNKHKSLLFTGVSSIIVIFSVLSFTMFAMASLATMQANNRLSIESAESTANYYKADTQAEKILSEIRDGNVPKGVNKMGNTYSYTCQISDTNNLEVKVKVKGDDIEVLSWKVVYCSKWEPDDTLDVWDGN